MSFVGFRIVHAGRYNGVADIVVKSNADAELVAPSFGYDADTKIITITDEANDSANVEKYVLGVFANAEADTPAYTIDVVSGPAKRL